ncbi:GTP-binding protein [Serendipita sp. 399]|nr:GTP-binding protein [Serendipita sp. 399]
MAQAGTGDLMRKRKICVLGSRAVGKSSLIVKFVEDHFVEPYYPTIEQSYFKQVQFKGKDYDVSIIDTAGQDEYSLLSAKHAVGIHGYLLVYSVINRQSFEMVRIVYEKLKAFQDIEHLPAVVVGQKSDLVDKDNTLREVTADEAEKLAKECNLRWIETSAKANANVTRVFDMCLEEIEKSMNPNQASAASNQNSASNKDGCIVM